jgi:hypothetical protein
MFFAKAPITAIVLMVLAAGQASAEVSISTDSEGHLQVQAGSLRVDRNYRQRRRIKKVSRYSRTVLSQPQARSTTTDDYYDEDNRRSDRSSGSYQRSTQTVTVNGRSHTVTQTTTSD